MSVERDSRMPIARRATIEDLESLLDLFRASDVSAQVETIEQARDIWRRTITRAGVTVFVSEAHPKIVATCMLITAPNLLRQGRSHAFLENVVTHPAHQGQGHGRAVVEAALAQAWSSDCHHVLMQSGRADPRVASLLRTMWLQARATHGVRSPETVMSTRPARNAARLSLGRSARLPFRRFRGSGSGWKRSRLNPA